MLQSAHASTGVCHQNMFDYESARKAYEQALEVNPTFYEALIAAAAINCVEGNVRKTMYRSRKSHAVVSI